MNDFNPNSSGPDISAAIALRTVSRVEVDRTLMDDFLLIHFTDGSSLRLRYDWIYEWYFTPGEP